jgi:ribosome-associated protein
MRDSLIEEAITVRQNARETQQEFSEDWPSKVAEDIAAALPSLNKGELVRLAYFFAISRNPRHSRELFRMLHAAQEQQGRRISAC